MFHTILGFGGRMARREYFFANLALRFLVGLLLLALSAGFTPHGASHYGERPPVPTGLLIILFGFVLPFYLWFALAFQAKRYRDMGWNPLYVMPGSVCAFVMIGLLFPFVPGMAVVGVLLYLCLGLSLLFWPSQPTGNGDWYSGSYHDSPFDPQPEIDTAPAFKSRRPATVRTSAPPPVFTPAPTGFGRRGL